MGKVYAGPYVNQVKTANGTKTVTEYIASGPGMNGNVKMKLAFWEDRPAPGFVQKDRLVYVSGKFSTYDGKDKEGNSVTHKTITVNGCFDLGENQMGRTSVAVKKVDDDLENLGF